MSSRDVNPPCVAGYCVHRTLAGGGAGTTERQCLPLRRRSGAGAWSRGGLRAQSPVAERLRLRYAAITRMAEAWVYIDESQAPHASPDLSEPFWLGALVTSAPIPAGLVEQALSALAVDPDATRADRATLERGYFHASFDSKNAHSALCRAIVGSKLAASFSTSFWFFGREGSESHAGARLHRLAALLSIASVLDDEFEAVHAVVARRQGSFEDDQITDWPTYCREVQFGGLIRMGGHPLSTRFPLMTARAVGPEEPGIQVCDFVLWAVQRARPDKLTLRGKRDWFDRLKLQPWAGGGMERGPLHDFAAELGTGARRRGRIAIEAPPPRVPTELHEQERFELLVEIVGDVRRAAELANASARIGHLGDELRAAVRLLPNIRANTPSAALTALNALARAFVLVCDTLPVYDVEEPRACSRACEKRSLAAAFLSGRVPLWLPVDGSL